MYAHSHNEARIFELLQEISRASQKSLGLSVSEFFGYLQVRWDELAQYDPVSDFGATTDVAVKRMDRLHTYFFLMGLKPDFENLRGQILNTSPLPSLLDTFAIVDGDERRRLISTPTLSPIVGVVFDQMAFAASSSFHPTGVKKTCHHCGDPGHIKDTCWKLHPELKA
ncbi:hypothetical protein RHGRI_026161 [Rhododendron griersonianum]|uniref:CCHC-type domain-containing protein n=1 Tax=Rhododendron griersonianum TaxID=479676 RepID=A0AAV6IW73_9ERIC|nr:hypothetical protein RHGRI_026161 [Rhododendron griersonianum]